MNYYRRYVGDYLRATSRLSLVEHGAYCLMLDYVYADEKPLPLDRDEVCRIIRAVRPEERKAVDKILALKFQRRDDGYHNQRADEELGKAIPLIDAAKENGKKGGRRKNPAGNPVGSENGTQRDTEQQPAGVPNGQHTPAASRQPPASLTTSRQRSAPEPPTAKGAAAAYENGLFYPEKLTSAERREAGKVLNGNPHAQFMLDELAGAIESKKGVDSHIGMLKHFLKLDKAGTMSYSHAARIQAAREGEQVRAELAAAGKSDVLAEQR